VSEPVVIGTAAPIPAGSKVHGTIEASEPAKKGSRAMLLLAVNSIDVMGTSHEIHAVADSMVAGSTRTRNVGAVAGGAAAGALIGHAVGGGKGALIGGLLGGGAAAGGVAASKGYQVVVKEGEELTFKTVGENTIK
jgi:outer membrane lipoprotein SlyB